MNAHEHRSPELEGELAPSLDDPRVVEALERYLTAVEAGERPNRQAFLARHADIAEALAACLDGMEALHVAAASPRDAPPAPLFSLSQEKEEAGGPAGLSAEVQPEAPLGDFRIVREIGRGGMGIVYEAVQMSLGRRVALKVLPFAAALDTKQLQRFKTEAQAAAHLHHTNIVPVYAVGCERGVHFYAMQLIEGLNLADLIEDLRRCLAPGGGDAARPRPGAESTGPYPGLRIGRSDDSPVLESAIRNPQPAIPRAETRPGLRVQLSTQRSEQVAEFFRTVARLAAQAAEALDHAHGVGVVHRDVKPANLLVDERGNLWVTDFGLARLHDDAGLTQSGDLLGTLRYMSPEQAGGPRLLIDYRTDVYSLGATLYELLTLRPIFDGADRQTLLHQIMHEEPRPPRSIDRSIPPELETIVLKAVAKLPAERYATARDLAQDLHRFLRHEPILARRPTLVQRARKWLRRHPSVVVAAVVLLGMLTAGSLVAALLIQGEKEKTRQAYERERQRAEEAEQRFQLARQSVDEMIQLAEQELAGKPHMEGLRKRLLETALVYYQAFIEQRRDDPGAQADLTATQVRVRRILADLALLQGAGQYYLLGNEAVLDALGPSEEQRTQIRKLSRKLGEQWMGAFRDFHRLTAEERERRLVELARASDADVTAVLTPVQIRRLKQIALQARGTAAFRDSDVVATLRLTADQKASIRAIEAEAFSVKLEKPPPRGLGSGDLWKDHDQAQKAAVECIRQDVLTEEQQKRWRELTGEPFKGSLGFFRPRPPGPPGPPGPFGPPR